MNTYTLTLDKTGWLEINYTAPNGAVLQSTSYHPTQLDLLQADAESMGTPLDDHAAMLNAWVTSYVPPAPEPLPVPQPVTAFQAKAALLGAGLLDDVEALMAHPDAPRIVKLAWSDALTFERTSPTVNSLGALLGLTDAQLDDLFVAAAQITA